MNDLTKTGELDRAFVKQIAFEVDDGFTKTLPQAIVANFDEVKKFIVEQTENDRLAVVTEETIDDFKKRKSLLTKQRDAINAQKIEVHKTWDEPYKTFEEKCKDLLAVFDAAIGNIDGQLKSFDNAAKEEKRTILREYWETFKTPAAEYRAYDEIENPKWLNKSVKKEAVFAEMDEIAEKIGEDIETLKALKSPVEKILLSRYKDGDSVRQIISMEKSMDEIISATRDEPKSAPTGELMTISMSVTATADQFVKLRGFFKENGIKFEKI